MICSELFACPCFRNEFDQRQCVCCFFSLSLSFHFIIVNLLKSLNGHWCYNYCFYGIDLEKFVSRMERPGRRLSVNAIAMQRNEMNWIVRSNGCTVWVWACCNRFISTQSSVASASTMNSKRNSKHQQTNISDKKTWESFSCYHVIRRFYRRLCYYFIAISHVISRYRFAFAISDYGIHRESKKFALYIKCIESGFHLDHWRRIIE